MLFVCVIIFSSLNSFANEILIPENITVISINGEEQGFSFFSRQTKFPINVGANVIQVRYEELFDDSENDDHVIIKSKPFMVTFDVEGDTDLKLIVPYLVDEADARKFAKKPEVIIETLAGEQLITKQNKAIDLITKQQIKAEQNIITKRSKKLHSDNIQQTDENMAAQMLNYWWHKATPQQRADFLKQIQK